MRTIKRLLEVEKQGDPMTEEEMAYVVRYKAQKHVKHSAGFIAHTRKIPDEEDDER